MSVLREDIRFGFRQLARQRGSSIVAVLTLALGIGVTTAIFSVIDATMLRPLPYPDPELLVTLGVEAAQPDGRISRPTPSMEDMRAWQAADDAVTSVAGWGRAFRGRILDGPVPERIEVLHFTEQYLEMHGVTPLIGRGFDGTDCDPGAPLVAMISYGYWQSHFGGRPDVLGSALRLDTDVATVVGVLPAWFNPTTPVSTPLRIPANEFARRGTGRVSVYAKLRPDVTIEQARARLSARMSPDKRPDGSTRTVSTAVTPRLESAVARYRTIVNVLGAAVALILILACVNVAGLLLARGAARQPELAVRASLGARRGRLIRQLLTESVILAAIAGGVGVALAWVSLDVIVANIPLALPANSPATLNPRVLAATAALLMPTALLLGLVPAIRQSRVSIGTVLARRSRQVGSTLSRRGGQLLIAAEVALAVILVAGAGLMIRSFLRISAVDLGFDASRVATMEVLPLEPTGAAQKAYYDALLQRVRTMPGIAHAGLVDQFALGSGTAFSSVRVGGKETFLTVFQTTPGYFEAIEARLVAGRLMSEADYSSGYRGVVISESAARTLFPDGPAVGREIQTAKGTLSWTVLGVIGDLRHGGPLMTELRERTQVYYPFDPGKSRLTGAMYVVVRPARELPDLAERLRQAAHAIGPRAVVERIRTGDELFMQSVIGPRRQTVLLALLGGLGLVLALVGVFGMTAYSVARRTSEIGVRLAFGARPAQVVRRIVRDAAIPIVIGTLAGVAGASFATRVVASLLFDTAPTDAVTFAAVAATLTLTGCVAAFIPALRAAKVDPAASLRAE